MSSGDSGAQLSVNSDMSASNGNSSHTNVGLNGKAHGLEVLKEQESPDFAPFDQEVYGCSVSISSNASSQSKSNNVYQTPLEAKMQQTSASNAMATSAASTSAGSQAQHEGKFTIYVGFNRKKFRRKSNEGFCLYNFHR